LIASSSDAAGGVEGREDFARPTAFDESQMEKRR
jgi:hypothetical protein